MKTKFPVFAATLVLLFGIHLAAAQGLTGPRGLVPASARKPVKTVLQPGQDPNRIAVKFRDGLNVRLRNNALVSTNAQLLAGSSSLFQALADGKWERAEAVSENTLDDLRHRAEQRLGRALPDMNLQFYLTLPPGMQAGSAIDRLNQLDIVDLAQPVPRCAPAPLPPDFEPSQAYCQAAPIGGGVFNVWTNYGVSGAGIRVADVEYSFNSNHLDLPAIVNLTPEAVDPFNDDNHGTATLGEISALDNGWGTTGIGHGATFYFAGADYPSGYNVGSGITLAASQLRAGDILLIEQTVWGPNSTPGVMDTGGEYGTVPVDWYEPYYNDIVMAVGLGIIVIETADNGGQNLDGPIYSTGNGGNWPFLPQNRSGAIIVGAGASLNGSSTESSPLYFANYGSCVDLHNWGENIVTTGYGDLYSAEGTNLYYTATFGGTSGATPIVVGEAALLQSIYQGATGRSLTSAQIKTLLRNTGLPQTGGAYPIFANIGPLPNVLLAAQTALSITGPPAVVASTTNTTALVGGTATLGVAASGAQPLTYQWYFHGMNLTDGPNVSGSTNAELVLLNLTAAQAGSYSVTVTNSAGAVSAAGILSVISDPAVTPGVTLSNLYTFTDAYDGAGPVGLTPDGLGDLYGMTQYGGTNGFGGIYEFMPSTQLLEEVYSFTNGVDGAYPFAPMVLGDDGNLYGTTEGDGQTSFGTIFSFGPGGAFNPLYSFTGGSDGGRPQGTLVEGPDELFYGTAYDGGSQGQGVIFTVDFSGNYNVVHNFDFFNGSGPYGGLCLASDGRFYGTTTWGGANNQGMIYRFAPDLTFSNLFSFAGTNGINPSDDLVQGLDGRLYGSTYGGGANGYGTVFSISTNGAFQLLFSFAETNGANPHGALIAGNDGYVYGATTSGGTNGQDGVVYEVTPGRAFNVVAYFDGLNGARAFAPLVRNNDGNFYGTTFQGGYDAGVIFKLSFASTASPTIENVTKAGGQISLTSSAIPGRSYQLQSTTNLSSPTWTALGTNVTATGAIFSVTNPLPQGSQEFYRFKLELP
ncbi:MAG: choice-of-anchor tandem repeat GloVer-containing protein [Verrucomicrobiota bacterium]